MADVTIANAVSAYTDSLARGGEIGADRHVNAAAQQAGHATGPRFSDLMEQVLNSAQEAGKNAEAMSTAAIKGEAGLHQVVTAVASAEVTLQTVMAVRDRVITAYQDILRMPI